MGINDGDNKNNYLSEYKDNRIVNSARTGIVSLINMVVVTLGPFVLRTLMIRYLGDAYAGLNSVLVSIMSMISLAELGFASAIVYFLYEPIANGDRQRVEAYLNVLRYVYRIIGTVMIVLGIVISFFLNFIITDEVPNDVNLMAVYFIYLFCVTIQYYIHPDVLSIATASQRGDLVNIIYIAAHLVAYIFQIVAIVVFRSFMLYFVAFLGRTLTVIILKYYIKHRYFPDVNPHGKISPEELTRLKTHVIPLIGHQMDDKFLNNIDSVIVSYFLGLTMVSIYGNYMYVVTAVTMLVNTVFDALLASIGNAMVTESRESNLVRFKAVFWMNGMVAILATACMTCMYQPFMVIWVGEGRLLPLHTVFLFCIYYFVRQIRTTILMFKNANGMWREDRYKPYVSMIVNLIVDIILVLFIGIDGALISSILCVCFIEIPWENSVFFRCYFECGSGVYLRRNIEYLSLAVLLSAICFLICNSISIQSSILKLFIGGGVSVLICVGFELLIYRHSDELKTWRDALAILRSSIASR